MLPRGTCQRLKQSLCRLWLVALWWMGPWLVSDRQSLLHKDATRDPICMGNKGLAHHNACAHNMLGTHNTHTGWSK